MVRSRHHASALGAPGELVWARLFNALENPGATGKSRPVILVARVGSQWWTMGLTTNAVYSNGAPRTPILDPRSVGLAGPGFQWGDRLALISVLDVGDHIG